VLRCAVGGVRCAGGRAACAGRTSGGVAVCYYYFLETRPSDLFANAKNDAALSDDQPQIAF